MQPKVEARNRADWRDWLEANHDRAEVVWLVFYKKHTNKPGIGYRESVEEAICFGWIDGLKKRIDDARYAHRFTPRKAGSKWSPLNIRLAKSMIAEGRMAPAGQAAYDRRRTYDESGSGPRAALDGTLPPEMEKALRANATAWKNYRAMAPGYRKRYANWLASAVKPETREKRLKETIRALEQNKKPGT